jgi:hypothetical protein
MFGAYNGLLIICSKLIAEVQSSRFKVQSARFKARWIRVSRVAIYFYQAIFLFRRVSRLEKVF